MGVDCPWRAEYDILQKTGRTSDILTPDPLMEVRRMLGSLRSEMFLGLSDCLPLLLCLPSQYAKDQNVNLCCSPLSLKEGSVLPFMDRIASQTWFASFQELIFMLVLLTQAKEGSCSRSQNLASSSLHWLPIKWAENVLHFELPEIGKPHRTGMPYEVKCFLSILSRRLLWELNNEREVCHKACLTSYFYSLKYVARQCWHTPVILALRPWL